MNALIFLNGQDVTDQCRLQDTRINYDSSRRITTASITVMGQSMKHTARYDFAHYDQDRYSIGVQELYLCTIYDGRDGTTKLFEGQIFSIDMEQSDGPTFEVFYKCELNDYATWLDRSVCWGGYTLPLPASDAQIIQGLVGHFCTQINSALDVATIVPVVQAYEWKGKTTRQVLDDMAALAGAEWTVDFNAVLHYRLASNAPVAPFALSTLHDDVSSFQVKVGSYKQNFSNPVNRCYVRGSTDPVSGTWIEASYVDPVSAGRYGEFAYSVIDEQITTAWDASLRAKSVVLRYAYPVETGNFTIWKDGLKLGQQVFLTEDALGVEGWYIIRSLTMQWESQEVVRYEAQFGASAPDLETILRLMEQRTRWKSSIVPSAPTLPGSITDANIKTPPGLSAGVIGSVNASAILGQINAGQIGSVNANTILGQINAGQIGSVNAGAIVGQLTAGQIQTVNAGTIQGVITAGQIGSVNATTIQGVIVSDQLANQIIDDLAKYASSLAPIPMVSIINGLPKDQHPPNSYFYYIPDGHFYRITADGLSWVMDDSVSGSQRFYHVGAISANQIIGLIVAAQIQNITAGQITGQISAGQIGTVNASSISGTIQASQISTVNASSIQGAISATNITAVNASAITGTIQASQIAAVNASTISGTIVSTQIGSINAATITIGLVGDSQISGMSGAKLTVGTVNSDKLNSTSIDVGGGGSKPGKINVYNASAVIAEIGTLTGGVYGGWFKILGAGGTGYSNAPLYTDASGNLFIKQASFTITASDSSKIESSPTTYDATYASIQWKVSKAGDSETSLISRGIVLKGSAGNTAGAFVRSPTVTHEQSGELFLSNSGTITILMDGHVGTVRADGGFSVAGSAGSTGSFVAGTKTVTVTKGIITSIV